MLKKFFLSLFALVIFFPAVSQAAFSDVPQGHWAYNSVTLLEKDGVIPSGGTFNGNANATRYDMAIMISGLFDKVAKEKVSGNNTFSDVPKNNPAYHAVETVAALEVVSGYGDGTFQGNKEITRQELALALNTFLDKGGITVENVSSSFSDIPAGHWAYKPISRMVTEGFMDGYGDGTFKGDNKITKFELAMIIAKIDSKYFK